MLYRFERSSHFRITGEGSMSLSQVHYLPLAPPFFFILVGLFVAILVLIQLGVLRYAYMRGREPAEVAHSCPHCGKASRRDHWNESLRPRSIGRSTYVPHRNLGIGLHHIPGAS